MGHPSKHSAVGVELTLSEILGAVRLKGGKYLDGRLLTHIIHGADQALRSSTEQTQMKWLGRKL